jgi:hypothetical protein
MALLVYPLLKLGGMPRHIDNIGSMILALLATLKTSAFRKWDALCALGARNLQSHLSAENSVLVGTN